MKMVRRVASLCAVVAFVAGCGGSLPAIGVPGVSSQGAAAQPALSQLLYATGGCSGTCVLSYPRGRVLGSLSLSGAGLCADKRGNIFMPSATSTESAVVYEYAHGGKSPKATLNVPGILAEGCSVDPTTGNLAVTYLCRDCSYGPVAIFQNAKGSPKSYEQAGVYLSFCGYDGKGNLFADGTGGTGFALLELPAGGNALSPISVSQSIAAAGQVQWDGTYVAIEDLSHPVIYQFKVSGSTATRKGTTKLTGAGNWGGQSRIQGGAVIVPYSPSGSTPTALGYWNYPAGGSPTKTIKRHLGTGPLAGVTVSL